MGHKDGILDQTTTGGLAHTGFGLRFKGRDCPPGDNADGGKTCSRGSEISLWQGLLQQNIRSTQAKWKVASNHRLKKIKRLHKNSKISHGVDSNCLDSATSGKFHFLDRSNRRLFSCTSSPAVQKISKTVSQGKSLPIQSSPLWLEHSSLSVHKNNVGDKGNRPYTGNTTFPVSGRLASPCGLISHRSRTEQLHGTTVSSTRTVDKREKIGTNPITKFRFYRCPLQLGQGDSISKAGELGQVDQKDPQVPVLRIQKCKSISVNIGNNGIPIQVHKKCKTLPQANTMASQGKLGSALGKPRGADKSDPTGKDLFKVVAKTSLEPSGGSSAAPSLPDSYFHRCVREGLGGSCAGCTGYKVQRAVVSGGDTHAHEQVRTKSCEASTSPTRLSTGSFNTGVNRQYHSGSPYKQTRGHSLVGPDGRDGSSLPLSHDKEVVHQGSTHSGKAQCHSGQPVKGRTDPSHRMESTSSGSRSNIPKMVQTNDRSVCNKAQHKVSNLYISSPGHESSGNRCSVPGLTRDGGLRLSPHTDSSELTSEVPEDNFLCSPSGGPVVAKGKLVPNSAETGKGPDSSASTLEKTTKTTRVSDISQSSRVSQPARLLSQEAALIEGGFDTEVAKRIANPLAGSTNKVYNAKWSIWQVWAEGQGRDPNQPDIPLIAKFLNKLFDDGQSVSSIAGYRAALATSLKFTVPLDISHSEELSRLILYFGKVRPPCSRVQPKWDLAIVLWTLLDEPFEPVWDEKKCPLKFLTWKVAFLLLLASCARRGELHAIPFKNVSIHTDAKYVTLKPEESFISKTRTITGKPVKPFVIPSLKRVVGDKSQDRKLCPVRAVQAYIHRTPPEFRKERKKFLVSYSTSGDNSEKDICLNTLSCWITSLIEYCYKQPGKQAIKLSGRNTHEIRAYASTLVHKGSSNLEDVLAAGQWTNQLVFIEHYLRDITEQQGALHRLGSIVAGQKVVQL